MSITQRPIRIIYFGTPAYAVPALKALVSDPQFDVALVVTQPDRPAGRGRLLQASAVKLVATELGLPVFQPESLRTAEARKPLDDIGADLFIVAAYGLIFGPKTLSIPRLGCLNLHASLLPKYRGASPISAAILSDDDVTGVTLMRMNAGMDTGDIVAMRATAVLPEDTTGSLTGRLAALGAELAVTEIPRWIEGDVIGEPQSSNDASYVRPLVKADGWINWSKPAVEIERQIRAMQPWPRAWTTLPNGATLQITRSSVVKGVDLEPGRVQVAGKDIVVSTVEGALRLCRVQPAGSGEVDGYALIQGRRLADGNVVGELGAPDPPPPMIQPAPN